MAGNKDAVEPAPKRSTAAAFAAFFERRSLVMLGLGFAAGLPNLLIFDTLSAWLRESGLSLSVISFFALATLSYSLKFVWAPLIDRYAWRTWSSRRPPPSIATSIQPPAPAWRPARRRRSASGAG